MHSFEDYVAYIVLSIQEFLDIKAGGEQVSSSRERNITN